MSPEESPKSTDDNGSNGSTKHKNVRNVKHRTLAKAKELTSNQLALDHIADVDDPLYEFENSPAFDPSKFWGKKRPSATRAARKVWSILHASGETVIDPKQSLKSRATKTTAGKIAKRQPRTSRKADLQFLEAHEELEAAEISRADSDDEDTRNKKDGEVDSAAEQVRTLQDSREAMRVAWMTRRHVKRVKVVSKKKEAIPDDSYFEKADDCGATEFMWMKWIGFVRIQE